MVLCILSSGGDFARVWSFFQVFVFALVVAVLVTVTKIFKKKTKKDILINTLFF